MVLTRVAQGVTRWSLPRVEGIWESTGGRTLPAPGQEACPLETDPASWIVDSKYAFAADVKWAVIARHYHTFGKSPLSFSQAMSKDVTVERVLSWPR